MVKILMSVEEARSILGDRAEWQLKKIKRELKKSKGGGLYSTPNSNTDKQLEAATVLLKDIRQKRKYPDRYYPGQVSITEEIETGTWRNKKSKKKGIDLSSFDSRRIFR